MTQKEIEDWKMELAGLLVDAGVSPSQFKIERKIWDCFNGALQTQQKKWEEEIEKAVEMLPWWIERADDIIEDVTAIPNWQTNGALCGIHDVAISLKAGLIKMKSALTPTRTEQ